MFSWCWGPFPKTSTPGLQEPQSPPHFAHVGDSPKCLPAGSSPSKVAGDTVLQWNSEPHHGRSARRPTFPPESADPGLCQGRGGAWDHRRCGTWLSGRKQRHTPSRQHLCQLHAPAIYMLLPNSYTYMPLPSVFQEVQDCRLPGLKPSKRFRRPPRQQLLQLLHAQQLLQLLHALPSVFPGAQDCRLPALKRPKRFQPSRRPPRQQLLQLHAPAICFSGGSRLPAVCPPQTPQTLPTLPQASKATTLTATTCPCHLFSGGSRLPFARPQTPQTLPTLPQASKATTLTATCPCHLFFRGFKTAVCPPSNPPNPSAGLQGNNSYSYMPLPSVFQGVQDCRLPALKPPKPFRRPPRQQLLRLHAPAICFSGGSRLPFARPQTPQTLPQASKATTLTATCPCHLFFRGFKTAVCPPSNPPNASNPSAGLQGNNSYSYMPLPSVFQGVQDCCLPALKPPKRFQPSRRPPRQQLLQLLHAPAICFSGGSRLPFARPQTPQTLPQASKATTLTATCPCHLFFRGFKTAVCPASNPPNASNPPAGLQGNNSYSYMPLPSVFQEVQDCRLPGLKPSKRFRRPPRQQLLQLHAPAICFSGGSRLPFARPQTPQTLPTLPQASKATTLTATCPCHLFFRGFKTAVCPASNPPNASNPSAGLQGNNSYSYMPLPSVFQGVQDCRLPALKPPKPFRRPPRQQLLQLHAPAICFSGGSRLPFARPQTPQTLPQASNHLHAPAICFSGGSRLPLARPQTLQTLPQASKATTLTATTCPTTLTATCPCHLFFREFKTAVCPASNPPNASNPPAGLQGNNSYSYMPLPSVFQGVQDCRLPAPNPPNASNPPAGLQGNNSYSYYMPLPSVFQGVQDCRLPALKPPKRFQPFRRPPRQQLLQLHAPAICFSGGSRQASKATTLTATCPCHLFFRGFKTAVCPPSNPPNASNPSAGLQGNNSYSYMPLPSVFQGVQDCRLPGLKPPKRFQPFRRPPRQQLLQLHDPAICFSGGSRLPFARPQTLPTLPQASKATTLTATCPCHLFFRGFKTAVCPPSNPPNPSAGLQGNNSYSYMPLPSVFQGVQDCRLPGLKPPKRFQPFRRPPRQQLLQLLHAPAICFSRGSRLPFARPQTPQTLPQAFKATTLTATCPCHLFFRGFKTAVCPPSNPPNPSNPPAGLQGNNSYSYMPLPSVFQGVQDCRLPALKPPKRFQPSRRPPRQQLLQLHAPAICFSGGSRLPFAWPQTPQTLPTLPQASKATTLTATTCPCHLFFKGFKTAVCPPSNPPNPSAGLQGNNSYSYMPLPSVFQGVQDCRLPALKPPKPFQPSRRPPRQQLLQLHVPAICFSGGSRLPFARPQTPQTLPTLPQASKATTLTATCPCHLFFRGFKTAVCPPSNPPNPSNPPAGLQGNNSYSYMPLPSVFQGVQDCRLPGLKPPKRFQPFRRPPRQQLLQLHAPAICFSGGSRLPFARPQTPQTLPQASKATTLTATCPCHLFFRGFKTAVCPPSNPPNASNPPAGLQGNNSYSYMSLPSVFQGVQDCRLPGLKPPKRFKPFRRPPRQQLLQLHAPAICFSGGSRLPFARPQTPQTLPQASKATTLTATCPCHLFFRGFKTAVCPPSNPPNPSAGLQGNNSYSYMPLPSVFQGVQDCRLPGLKPPKRFQPFRRPPRQQLLQLHAPAICFSGGSRLPFARPQTPQTLPTLPQASKATTLTATCPCHLFFRGFKTAVCPPSNPPNASNPSAGLQGNNSYSYMPLPSVFQGVQDCRLPGLNPPNASNPSAGLQGNNSYSYMPLPSVFQGVQDCRLPGLKPPKRFQPFRRPPRQQLLQLHAPAICFSGGSRLPFARPQTPQTLPTLPQASKATTLTATCPCHLFFRGFKTAVCSPSNPPNASNPSAGLQGNNSYSYMSLPSVFQGVQDCRLPGLKSPKRFQPSRRPPRQQLLQLHAPAICFSGGSRLPFARPQNPPNASAGLQGNNSYSYMTLPSVFQGVQDCRLPGLKPPKRFRRPPRQQLLQLHAPAICFSGGAWATRACDSPSLMGLLLWHEPFCFLAWFPSRRVMVDANLPKRTAWPHNSLTHRARVGMAPRLSADMALLHIKLVAAYAPMVYLPRFGVTWRFPIAKWAYVHVSFCHCADTALLHIKSVAANAPMVYSPRSGVAYSLPVAKWAHVNISFVHYACVLHAKSVPASAAMIYLTCTHRARHGFTTVRTLVFAQLSFLRCFSFLCWHRCLVAGLGVFLLFSLQVWLPFSGLVCSIFAFLCSSLCVLCFGVVHVSFPLFFCARFPHLRTGHFCFIVLSALCCLRLCLLRRAVLFSLPFSFRDGSPDISDGACLFLFRCFHRYFRLRCCDPLHRFADAPAGNGAFPAVAADLVTITRTMLRQPWFKSGRCLLHLADAASPPAPGFTRTIQTHSTARACSFPRPGRKFLFVLARLAHTTHMCLFARLTNTIKCGLWPCMFCLECIFLFPSRAGHALPRLLRLGVSTNASFVKNVLKNNADWFRFNPWSDLQATVKQECTLRTTQFMHCLLIMSCREWFVTNSFGLFCGASCGFLRYLSTEFNVDVW